MQSIKYLETLGRRTHLACADFDAEVQSLGLDDTEKKLLLGRDASKLASLLGGRAAMWFAVMAPEEAPLEEEEPSPVEPEPSKQDT